MKNSKILVASVIVLLIGVLAGCKDTFLQRPPEDQIVSDNFYNTTESLHQATGPLYNVVWFTFNDKAYLGIGDYASGNINYNLSTGWGRFNFLNLTSGNDQLSQAWQSFYTVIGQSNMTMMNIRQNASGNVPESAVKTAIAEARFMRAAAYFLLVRSFGAVPLITNNVSLIEAPDVPRHKVEDVYQFIINDLEYAVNNLPPTPFAEGRVTSWSAKGLLAEVYLSRAGLNSSGGSRNQSDLDMAEQLAGDVVNNSGLQLMDNYDQLFYPENENSEESLFALQWVYGGGWGTQNSLQAYLAYEPALTNVGDGWGGGTQASTFLFRSYSEADSIRRKATFMINGDHYDQLLTEEGGYTFTANNSGIKKYVIGTPADNGGRVGFMETPINSYMLRLAEVYLIYAEAILGDQQSTSNQQALDAYNAVRERAGLNPKSSITFMDIFMEKWKELAMEGQNWYELVRWHYFEPDRAVEFINNQNRNTAFTYNDATGDTTFTPPPSPITVEDSDFTFPLPENAVVSDPKLQEPPVDYDFSKQGQGEGENETSGQ